MQGRPKLKDTEHAYMQNVVSKAENDGAEAAIYRPVHEDHKQLDRTTLTSHDVEQLLSVVASMPQAARAREIILLNIQTGFRGCGIVEQSWGKLVWKIADLNVLPHKVEILGIGIAKDQEKQNW